MNISPQKVHTILGRRILTDGLDLVFDFEKSKGSYLYDSRRSRRFLDFFGFFSSMPIGYNHPALKDKAYLKKLFRVSQIKPTLSDIYTTEFAEFVETFARLAGKGFSHYFFISGGAQAVENALKCAFDWKVRKNLEAARGERGKKILHFRRAFHGRTGYAISITNPADIRKIQYYPIFDWPRITNPAVRFPLKEHLTETKREEARALWEIETAFRKFQNEIAAIIIEPIQGEGGDNHFRGEFLRALRRIANQKEALLIFDEVQAGLGATGEMWCFEHFGVRPDILIFGKRTQISGIAATRRIDDVDNVFKVPSRINSTFGGDLVDMVRCARYLEVIYKENLLENASRQGRFLLEGLLDISKRKPVMTNVRGRGLILAFDLPGSRRARFIQEAYRQGLLLSGCGERSIRLRPMLTVNRSECEEALGLLEKSASHL